MEILMKRIPMILTKEKLMNHTLKSLLITSMLTIPTVFASHDSLLATNSDTHPAAAATALGQPTLVQQTDVPALIKEADRLRNLKTSTMDSAEEIQIHTASVAFYEQAANHPDATLVNIRLTADKESNLGDYYPEGSDERNLHLEISAKLYTKLANHLEATPGDILNVAKGLNALAKTYPKDSAERLKFTAIAKNLPKK